jgi:hypothetical protein
MHGTKRIRFRPLETQLGRSGALSGGVAVGNLEF